MRYFVTDVIGLIIAALNVATVLLLVYVLLEWVADERSRLLRVLDRIWSPLLAPLRRVLPAWRIDAASLILALILQIVILLLKRGYR
jgi:uncharacterized protein YggT (Ycf19 family)